MQLPKKMLIVGLGLLGGSYAEALSSKGYEMYAIAHRQASIDYAVKKGIIKAGTIEVDKDFVSQFDLVIFALYPHILVEWIKKYHTYLKPGAILTDVTGVKRAIIPSIKEIIKDDPVEFVFAHPMAGREVYGVENATGELFKKANFIVTPTPDNKEESILLIEQLGWAIGSHHVARLTPEMHDEMIGYVSQLAHVIAVSLMTAKDCDLLYEYTGNSFRDLTRIADINEDMWSELFMDNKDKLLEQIDLFMAEMTKMRNALDKGDVETMKKMMELSSFRRKKFRA